MPAWMTSCGILLLALDTRFCTFTAAMSGSVPCLKKTVRVMLPSLLELDVMYVMFSTPFTASSMGVATERATVSALAPGYDAVTTTVGGAMSGNWEMGKVSADMAPSITKRMEITVDSTGRSINFCNIESNCFNQEKNYRSEERRVGKESRSRRSGED